MVKALRFLALGAVATVAMAYAVQDSFLLRHKFQKGATLTYELTDQIEQDIELSAVGQANQEMTINTTGTMAITFDAVAADGGSADFTAKFSDYKMEGDGEAAAMMTGPGMPSEFTASGKVDSRGKASDIEISGIPEAMLAQLDANVKSSLMVLLVYPENAISVGDSWEFELPKSAMYGDNTPTMTATVVRLGEYEGQPALEIKLEGALPVEMDMSQMMAESPMGPMNMVMTGEVETSMTAWIDPTSGTLLFAESTSESDLQMELKDFGFQIPITGSGSGTIKLKK